MQVYVFYILYSCGVFFSGAIFPSYFQERTYQTDTKVKVVNARPLKITRIREKKVLLETPTKPLVKERDLIDRSEEVNVYKRK